MDIRLDWLGCATFRLTLGETVVFLDAYMDRVPSAPPVGLKAAEVTKADFVLVGHAHFDHIGCHHEFETRCIHDAEAHILADPRNDWTLADLYATDEMFDGLPKGWDAASYHVKPAPPTRLLKDGDEIDLGDRVFEVVHTPGHSPGGIALWEKRTRTLLSGDIVYDGPLIDDAYHSDLGDYETSLRRLMAMPIATVHGGHFPSFDGRRLKTVIDEYLAGRRKPGCPIEA